MFGMYADSVAMAASIVAIVVILVVGGFILVGVLLIRKNPKGSGLRMLGWFLCLGVIGLIIAVFEDKNDSDDRIKKLENRVKEKDHYQNYKDDEREDTH